MQNFRNLGASRGGGDNFLTNPQKADFTCFEPLCVPISSQVQTKKRDTTRSHRGYISRIYGEFPTQPNLTKIGIRVGFTDVINHIKFRNDRFRYYKVTEGRILPCSIGMACRL